MPTPFFCSNNLNACLCSCVNLHFRLTDSLTEGEIASFSISANEDGGLSLFPRQAGPLGLDSLLNTLRTAKTHLSSKASLGNKRLPGIESGFFVKAFVFIGLSRFLEM